MSAWIGTSLTDVYGFTGSWGTVAIVLVYVLANIGFMKLCWKQPDYNALRHLVLPAVGTLILLYPLYQVAKPGQGFPYNLVPYGVLGWVILGFVVYAYLQKSAPAKLAALGATMATDEIDFAEAKDHSLSTGELPRGTKQGRP